MSERNMMSGDEREALLGFLDKQREGLRTAVYGLTFEESRSAPSASALSVAGLIKHAAKVEREWASILRGQHRDAQPQEHMSAHVESFQCGDIPVEELLADYAAAARETDEAILAAPGMDDPVPVPQGVPWFPKDIAAWNVRWVLVHLIEETARHAGHADVVRESVDGAQAVELLAAVQGRPENGFIKPWRRAESAEG